MRTTFRKGRKVIVEDFTFEEMREYLSYGLSITEKKELLLKIANAVHGNNSCEYDRESNSFKLFTIDNRNEETKVF